MRTTIPTSYPNLIPVTTDRLTVHDDVIEDAMIMMIVGYASVGR